MVLEPQLKSLHLHLFLELPIIPYACVNPLASWHIHEGQFSNVNFLVNQTLGILGSKMETKHEINLVGDVDRSKTMLLLNREQKENCN
jgi:hypothetical protein